MRNLRLQLRTAGLSLTAAFALVAGAQADPPLAAGSNPVAPAAPSPLPAWVKTLRRTTAEWASVLATLPELSPLAAQFAPLPLSATQTALDRGGRNRSTASAWSFVDGAFSWSPRPNRTFWIVTGTAGPRVVIAVLEPGEKPKHLASAVLLEAHPALAVGVSASDPERVSWTTCYGCPGLGGSITLAADGRPVIEYR